MSTSRRVLGATLTVLGLALLGWAVVGRRGGLQTAAGPLARPGAPILLVTLDTTRPDRLEPYGAEDVETPNLARLAAEGVVFERAYSVAPITLVAHTTILSGLEPPAHGVRNNGLHYVPDEVTTLAERLGGEGYATAAFVSAAVLDHRYNLGQGFDLYDDDLSTGRERSPRMVADRPAEATIAAATAWLDQAPGDRPWFLWVHLYDPHAAYSPPPPFRDRYRERLYDGEIAYLDSQLGRLLEHPRVRQETVVSVLGDHGESLGQHGEQTHALLAYDSTLHVPWILKVPSGPRGRIRQAVGHVDVVPTLLEIAGLRDPGSLPGASLAPLLAGSRAPLDRPLYSETHLPYYTYGWSKLHVLRRDDLKWIDAPDPELYDTSRDPRELSNLRDAEPGAAHDLARDLRELLARHPRSHETELTLDDEAREALRSLGYLAAGSSPPDAGGSRPDPKTVVGIHVKLERARHLMRDRLWPEAVAELEGALRQDRGNLAALIDLTAALAEQGELEEARATAERALALDPAYPRLYTLLAEVETRSGDLRAALGLLEKALEIDPRYLDASLQRASLLFRLGREPEGAAALAALLAGEPGRAPVAVLHARLVDLPRDPEEAMARVRAARASDPFFAPAWQLEGEIHEAAGRIEEARQAYREGLRRRPDDAGLHGRLGVLLARTRGGAEAESHLREAIRLASDSRPELHVALGGWLAERGRFEEAQRQYDRVLADHPRHPGALNNRAVALYRTGRPEEAVTVLRELVERVPGQVDALNNLSAIALTEGRPTEAEVWAEKALARNPGLPEAWNNLGLARQRQGRATEAIASFERALAVEPSYWAARLNLGQALEQEDQAERAAAVLAELVRDLPTLAEAHLSLGRLYAGPLADPARARSHFNAFLRQAPEHPEAARVREAVGNLSPAEGS